MYDHDEKTPTRPGLQGAESETSNGNGHDPRRDQVTPSAERGAVNTRETQRDRIERTILELHGMHHRTITVQETHGQALLRLQRGQDSLLSEVRKLSANHTLLQKAMVASGVIKETQEASPSGHHQLPPPRAKLQSVSDITFEEAVEGVTEHGTRTFTYTEEALRAKMRIEYTRMMEETQVNKDAAPVRFVRAQLLPHVLKGVGLTAAAGLAAGLWYKLVSFVTTLVSGNHHQ
jgi:hypothetical protein